MTSPNSPELPARLPRVAYLHNPLITICAADFTPVPVGSTIEDHRPSTPGTWVCWYNTELVLPDDWKLVELAPADRVVFVDMPQNSGIVRSVFQIAIVVAAAWVGGPWGIAIAIGGNLALNALLPVATPGSGSQAQQQEQKAAQVFTTSISGNSAKLDDPIWKICGRRKITPPFAAQPYFEYVAKSDPDGTGDNSDQYYYALFAVGIGAYNVESMMIGITNLENFKDVTVRNYLPPGVYPGSVKANVYTSSDISNIDLDTLVPTSGYNSCIPLRLVGQIGIDVVAPQGLGGSDGSTRTVAWRVEYREITDYNEPTTAWAYLATEGHTISTSTPQRWTSIYNLPTPARVQIRLVRTDAKDTSSGSRHSIQWTAMRAFLTNPAPLNPHVTHIEIVMRASEQLNQSTQAQFSMVVISVVRTLQAGLGWTAPVETRNPAPAILELATSTVWGLGIPEAYIDLQSFYTYQVIWDARQDHCDYAFTGSMNGWDALQLLARTGRARVFRRNGVLSIARDEMPDLEVTAFTPRNTIPNSMVVHETLATRDMPDGYIFEYEDYRTWVRTPLEFPCPGFSAVLTTSPFYNAGLPAMRNPIRKTFDGIIGPTQVIREGLYEAASLAYRRTSVSCTVEMQGMLPAYMSTIKWLPELSGYGQSGDVVGWNNDLLIMTLSEPADFTNMPIGLTLILDDGSITPPVAVTPGPTEYDIVLPSTPGFDVVTPITAGDRERTKYILGTIGACDELAKVSAITDGGQSEEGAQLFNIQAIVDDVRVHYADNAYLPHGEIQDSYVAPGAVPDAVPNVRLNDHFVIDQAPYNSNAATHAIFELTNTGVAQSFATVMRDSILYYPVGAGVGSRQYDGEWSVLGGLDPASQASLFEVRFSWIGGYGAAEGPYAAYVGPVPPNSGTPLGVWASLATAQNVGLFFGPSAAFGRTGAVSYVFVEIRLQSTGAVQTSGHVTLYCDIDNAPENLDAGHDGESGEGDGGDV